MDSVAKYFFFICGFYCRILNYTSACVAEYIFTEIAMLAEKLFTHVASVDEYLVTYMWLVLQNIFSHIWLIFQNILLYMWLLLKNILYPYKDKTRDIWPNITLCLKEFQRARASSWGRYSWKQRVIFDHVSKIES